MTTDRFQRRDDGATFELIAESDADVTLRAHDEAHTVSVVDIATFAAHYDPTARTLPLDDCRGDGAGGVRLDVGDQVVHLDAAAVAAVIAAAGAP